MFTRGHSTGELVRGVHQNSRSNLGGAMWSTSVGTKKAANFLLTIRHRQLAFLVEPLQYSYELLGLYIGLLIQHHLLLMPKPKHSLKSPKSLPLKRSEEHTSELQSR